MNRVTEPHRTVEIQWNPLRVPGSWKNASSHHRAVEAFIDRLVKQGCEVWHEHVPTIIGNEDRIRIHIPLRNMKVDQVALGNELKAIFGADKLLHK